LGDNDDRGDDPNEMGNNLPSIELPRDFTPIKLVAGHSFNCVLNQSIYCWGRNNYYQLGDGSNANRGISDNQMGDNLDYVDVAFTPSGSSDVSTQDLEHLTMIDALIDAAEDATVLSVTGKDLLILALLISNVVFLTILMCKCIKCCNGQKVKYEAVSVLSENEV